MDSESNLSLTNFKIWHYEVKSQKTDYYWWNDKNFPRITLKRTTIADYKKLCRIQSVKGTFYISDVNKVLLRGIFN